MDFRLDNEQELLRDGLARFLSARYDLAASRATARTGAGWQPDIWRSFADELGILGATLPADVGGSDGGAVELMIITEDESNCCWVNFIFSSKTTTTTKINQKTKNQIKRPSS